MGDPLISAVSIHEICLATFSCILNAAYHKVKNISSPATIILLTEMTSNLIHHYTRYPETQTHVEPSFSSPFIGGRAHDVTRFLAEDAAGSILNPGLFLIADEKTTKDGNVLLLVQHIKERYGHGLALKTVRLAVEVMNNEVVAVLIGAKGGDELLNRVHEDRAFRCGRGNIAGRQPLMKGDMAPRRQV